MDGSNGAGDVVMDAIDRDELAAVAAAVRKAVEGFVYKGFAVGMFVTDEECEQVATAAVAAINKHRSTT